MRWSGLAAIRSFLRDGGSATSGDDETAERMAAAAPRLLCERRRSLLLLWSRGGAPLPVRLLEERHQGDPLPLFLLLLLRRHQRGRLARRLWRRRQSR